ncbi:FAD-dependent oxidoreductase [Piscirickettsia salmonis]|uniref:FAD-dependent oxidoreductase n=1 Tax=Piscirickettsia salmonis TaxID=1238 RepID=UPI0007C98FEF|nr:bifunctional tRNA (mnm(5)s(2)U34)-methyltransferase/FAD-dependent cmnm(5)s(2)U34 oxidoreductase [Piscirickettsiaceae bacterium NZ-RLO1]
MQRLAIIGAGLMGRVLALDGLSAGFHITLFDRDGKLGQKSCAYTAAGMLAPIAEVEHDDVLIYSWGIESLARWPQILAILGNNRVWFQQQGSLIVAFAQDHQDILHLRDTLAIKLSGLKGNNHPEFEFIRQDTIALLEPELNPKLSTGLFFPDEGQVSGDDFLNASADYLQSQDNIDWQDYTEVTEFGEHWLKTAQSDAKQEYDWVIDSRGLQAKHAVNAFPDLHGVRGEVIHLQAPTVTLNRPVRLIHPRYSIYVVPRANHHYVVGASSIESEDFSPPSVQSTLELLSAAYSLHRGFAEARILETRVNCRPTLPDHLPKIIYKPGLIHVNGLYRHGYLLAPFLSAKIIEHIKGLAY